MKCGYPIETPHGLAACRQCANCRVNHKRMWTGRILLEAAEYKTGSSFVTLTYDEEHLPNGNSLIKSHLRSFIRRLRGGSIGQVRYFAVGEYGSKSGRAHYHAILFGFTPWNWEDRIREAWRFGNVHVGELTPRSAAYTAQYCFKKTGDGKNPAAGETPEFKLFSKKPPLGAAGIRRIQAEVYGRHGSAMLEKLKDVPNGFRIQGSHYPIARQDVLRMREEVFQGSYMPQGTPLHEWYIDYDEAKKKADELARLQAAKHAKKRWARRNANSRTL